MDGGAGDDHLSSEIPLLSFLILLLWLLADYCGSFFAIVCLLMTACVGAVTLVAY